MGEMFDLLYARPSFLEGAARILDFGGTLNVYNRSVTPEEADLVALRSDWEALGQDLRVAISTVAEEIQTSPERGAQAEG